MRPSGWGCCAQAALPQHLGAPGGTLDALCGLHAECGAARAEALAAGDGAAAALAVRRADMTLHALVAFHASRADWRAALTWLDAASRAAPGDAAPLAAAGLLLLQIGDTAAAAAATDAAEARCQTEHCRAAVARNRAMLRFAAKDYAVSACTQAHVCAAALHPCRSFVRLPRRARATRSPPAWWRAPGTAWPPTTLLWRPSTARTSLAQSPSWCVVVRAGRHGRRSHCG
jgi:hypothetical protein